MTIAEVYRQYSIMPSLQLHMLRVAAVAQLLIEHFSPTLDEESILTACLLHDMGNIIKFDLTQFPQFSEPEGVKYWQDVQQDFIQRYGKNEHAAALAIAKELGVSARVQEHIQAVGFHQAAENLQSPDFAKKICNYADTRVTPFGVVSLAERCQDLENRYGKKYPSQQDQQRRREFKYQMEQIEQQIFAHSSIRPEDITDLKVNPLLEKLINFEIISA